MFLGELRDGVYTTDECEGLSEEEIYAFYNYRKTGEPLDEDNNGLDSIESGSESESDSVDSMSIDLLSDQENEVDMNSSTESLTAESELSDDDMKGLDQHLVDNGFDPKVPCCFSLSQCHLTYIYT